MKQPATIIMGSATLAADLALVMVLTLSKAVADGSAGGLSATNQFIELSHQ